MLRRLLASLQVRLTVFMVLLVLASLWLFALALSGRVERELLQTQTAHQFATVGYVAEDIGNKIELRLDTLRRVADGLSPALLADAAAVRRYLADRHAVFALFDLGLVVVRPELDGMYGDWPEVPGHRDADFRAAPFAEVASGGSAAVGPPEMDRFALQPVVRFAVPVRDAGGRLLAVLGGATSLDSLAFLDVVQRFKLGSTGSFLVAAPAHGVFVTGTDPSYRLKPLPPPGVNDVHDRWMVGEEGSGIGRSSAGVEELSSSRRIPAAGWFVVGRMPVEEAFEPMQRQRLLILGGAALASLLAAVLAALIVRRSLRPLEAATGAFDAISAGKVPLQPLPVVRRDEVGRLVASFNRLQERFAAAFRASPIAASIARAADGTFLEVNPRWQAHFGWTREELIGRRAPDIGLWVEDGARERYVAALRRDGILHDYLARWRRKDGAVRDISLSAEAIDIDGEPHVLAYAIDVTDRLRAERALAESEARNRRIVETANEGIWIIDPDTRVSFVNQRMADMLGYAAGEILGHPAEDFLHPEDLDDHRRHIAQRRAGLGGSYERRFRRRDGSELWTQVSGTAIMNPDGSYGGAFGMFTDITHLKEQQRQLQHIAHYDALTGIPNRVLLADRMAQTLAHAQRSGGLVAVCYVDLDGFKPVNDAWGHEAGDRLLVEIAHRLRDILRGGDTVARLGGDEFVLLLGMERAAEWQAAVQRVLDAVAVPLAVAGQPVTVSASVGVTLFPQDDADPDTLLRHADQAMYEAKQQGRNRSHLFDAERDREARAHRVALDGIAAALAAGEFVLHYQPKVNMRAGNVVGVEALIRWQHPQRGLLPPAEFLPLIEDTDLIAAVGEWVIGEALRQWQDWRALGLDLAVSVNIAARHLAQRDFVARLDALLQAHGGLPPQRLELEVLETAALADIEHVARLIGECRALGVGFALDDFGTGYSSLAYIKHLPADTLKIDQTFVRDMLRDPEDRAIVEGVIGLTRVFKRQVVAEGVETVAHGALLLELGCDVGQGYGIARPMPAAALPAWVAGWAPDPAWRDRAGGAASLSG